MDSSLPWNKQDIFHDSVEEYPLHDYFPITVKQSVGEEEEEKEA